MAKNSEFYFRRGVTYSYLTAGAFSARLSPGGFVFDVAGSSIFPENIPLVLALLNSPFAQFALKLINPTVNFQVGDLARFPVPTQSSGTLDGLVDRAVMLARADSAEDETTYDFVEPPEWPFGVDRVTTRHCDLAALEREIDEEVYRLYEISADDRRAIEEELAAAPEADADEGESEAEQGDESTAPELTSFTMEELAQRWISYAVGIALGRFSRPGLEHLIDADGLMVVQRDHPDDLAKRVIDILTAIHGDQESGRIVQTVVSGTGDLRDALAKYLVGPFFKAHVKQYRKRPVYWLFQSPKQKYSVYLFHERADGQTMALLQGSRYVAGRISGLQHSLRAVKEKESKAGGKEKLQLSDMARDIAEQLADLEALDQAISETNRQTVESAAGAEPVTAGWVPEFDDGVLLNAAPLYRLLPAWKRTDAKMDPFKAWKDLEKGEYPWAKTAMRYWPRQTLEACKTNKSYRIAHGLE